MNVTANEALVGVPLHVNAARSVPVPVYLAAACFSVKRSIFAPTTPSVTLHGPWAHVGVRRSPSVPGPPFPEKFTPYDDVMCSFALKVPCTRASASEAGGVLTDTSVRSDGTPASVNAAT